VVAGALKSAPHPAVALVASLDFIDVGCWLLVLRIKTGAALHFIILAQHMM
jgi:hypothetical protein